MSAKVVQLFDEIENHRKRETLLTALRNQSGDAEADHGEAEKLLCDWLRTFDEELAREWEQASKDWWYA